MNQSDISDNNNRIAKNTFMLYLRMFFTMAVSLYTSRIVLNTLGIEDYGIYNVVGGVVSMLAFFNSSMATSTQRFLNVEMGKGNYEILNKVFINAVNAHYLIGIVTVLGLETFGLWFIYYKLNIPEAQFHAALWVFHLSVASLFVSIISTPYNAAIIANEKMSVYAYFSIFEVIAKLLIVYLLLMLPYNKLTVYAILLFLISVTMRLAYNLYCKKYFRECNYRWIWDINLIKKMFSFTGWMLFGCLSDMLGNQGVNILINMFFGPVYNAARGIAVQIRTAIDSFIVNFLTAVRPQIVKSYSTGEWDYMYKLTFSASRLSYYLLLLLVMPVFFSTHYILGIWLKNIPPYCEIFTQLTLVELLIRTTYTPIAQINQASGKIRNYQLAISVLFLLNFILSYIVYKMGMPVFSSFIVAIVVAVVGLFVRLIILKHDNQFPALEYLKTVFLPIIPVTLLAIAIPVIYNIYSESSFQTFFIQSVLCVLCASISIWYVGLNTGEKTVIKGKINSFVNRYMK